MNHIKAQGPADVLASINHTLGFTPHDALVFLTLRGKTVGATLRIDLPSPDTDPFAFSLAVTDYLSADREATGTLVVIYTQEPENDGDEWPRLDLMGQIDDALEAVGKPVKEMWLVTPTSWRYYADNEEPEHPLSEVMDSNVNATLVALGSDAQRTSPVRTPFSGQDGNHDAIYSTVDSMDYEALDWTGMRPWRQLWMECMDREPTREEKLMLIATLQNKYVRDRVMADTFTQGDDLKDLSQTFLGNIAGVPDWASADLREKLLKSLLTEAPGETRAPIFAYLGWLSWLKGRSTLAHQYITLGLEEAPAHELSLLLDRLVASGHVAPINRDEHRSYRTVLTTD